MTVAAPTRFAPAERAGRASISRDTGTLLRDAALDHLARTVPCILLILNRQRQVVYANRFILDILGVKEMASITGKRPGELVECVNSRKNQGGCGTSEYCSECGAVLAILESQAGGNSVESECSITTGSGECFEFKVWAAPYRCGSKEFTVVSMLDIHDQKRRQALERTFFHDVGNLLMTLVYSSEFLSGNVGGEASVDVKEIIVAATRRLAEEVASQRRLLQAESGDLAVNLAAVDSVSVALEAASFFSVGEEWKGKTLTVDERAENFTFRTDRELLSRILVNMIKNALEAAPPGGRVVVSCRRKGPSAVFSVNNPGVIPRKVRLRIFQRSFSTKGGGRGVGTYSMKLFGEKYLGGKVRFTSGKKEGTTFSVSLPLKD